MLGDLHFWSGNMESQSMLLGQALQTMRKEGVGLVLNTGDTFELESIYDNDASTMQLMRAICDPIEKAGLPVIKISGNHDIQDPLKPSSINLFQGHRLIQVFEYNATTVGWVHGTEYVHLLLLPWQDRLWQRRHHSHIEWENWPRHCCEVLLGSRLTNLPKADCCILMGHLETEGAWADSYR